MLASQGSIITRIHDKWYDLSKFQHPGGPIAMLCADGRDATALFESHHPVSDRQKLGKILQKYECPPGKEYPLAREDDEMPFDWPADALNGEASPFGEDLRKLAKDYFTAEAKRRGIPITEAIKGTPERWLEVGVLFAMRFVCMYLMYTGNVYGLLLFPFLDWFAGAASFHDGSHFAFSTDWRINMFVMYLVPYFTSPTLWMHQHVIGHHNYTNIPRRDPDLYHQPPLMRNTKTLRWKPTHAHQWWSWVVPWTLSVSYGLSFLNSAKAILSGTYLKWVTMMKMSRTHLVLHIAARILTFLYLYALPFYLFSGWYAVAVAFYPIVMSGYLFMLSTQINHLTPANVDVSSRDYWTHQVLTSHSFGIDSYFSYILTGGLNLQIEHHLFPSISHCHLKYLSPGIKALCKKHNIYYHESSGLVEAFSKHMQHMLKMSDKNHHD